MTYSRWWRTCRVLAPVLAGAASTSAQEREISCQTVPPAVRAAFDKAFSKATIKSCIEDAEDGRTAYAITSTEGETRRDVYFYADGTPIHIEEEIAVGNLSPSMQQVVGELYPDCVIRTAEKITRDGAEQYKLHCEHEDELVELIFHPDGKLLVAEETLAIGKLPKSLEQAVQGMYLGSAIARAKKITRDRSVRYELEVAHQNALLELLFEEALPEPESAVNAPTANEGSDM